MYTKHCFFDINAMDFCKYLEQVHFKLSISILSYIAHCKNISALEKTSLFWHESGLKYTFCYFAGGQIKVRFSDNRKNWDFATISHFNMHTSLNLCWKFHAFIHKCTILTISTANWTYYLSCSSNTNATHVCVRPETTNENHSVWRVGRCTVEDYKVKQIAIPML